MGQETEQWVYGAWQVQEEHDIEMKRRTVEVERAMSELHRVQREAADAREEAESARKNLQRLKARTSVSNPVLEVKHMVWFSGNQREQNAEEVYSTVQYSTVLFTCRRT